MKLQNTRNPIKDLLAAFAISVFTAIVGAALLSWLVMAQRVNEKTMNYFATGIIAIATMFGGMYSSGKQTDKKWVNCMALAGMELFMLFGINIIFCDSIYANAGYISAAVLLGNLSAAFIKNKKKKHSRKYRNG